MKTPTINPELPIDLTIQPDWQDTPFTISQLDYDTAIALQADYEAQVPVAPQTNVEVPVARVQPKDEYIDFSTLEGKELVRRKISAWVYDRRNGTNMLDLLNQRIEDDRNVAMATKLGIISTVYCQKHQKAVDKLKHLV